MVRAVDLVTAHAAEVRAVVEALLERRFLTAAEIGDVIATAGRSTPPTTTTFSNFYLMYDERFVYAAPDLKSVTQHLE